MLVQAAAASLLYGALLFEALPAPLALARAAFASVTLFGCGGLVAVLRDRVVALLAESEERSVRMSSPVCTTAAALPPASGVSSPSRAASSGCSWVISITSSS